MSFGRDKYRVYENIVNLKLTKGETAGLPICGTIKVPYIDRSARKKSRNRLGHRNWTNLPGCSASENSRGTEHFLQPAERGRRRRASRRGHDTKEEIARREQELVEFLREVGSEKSGWAALQSMKIP